MLATRMLHSTQRKKPPSFAFLFRVTRFAITMMYSPYAINANIPPKNRHERIVQCVEPRINRSTKVFVSKNPLPIHGLLPMFMIACPHIRVRLEKLTSRFRSVSMTDTNRVWISKNTTPTVKAHMTQTGIMAFILKKRKSQINEINPSKQTTATTRPVAD